MDKDKDKKETLKYSEIEDFTRVFVPIERTISKETFKAWQGREYAVELEKAGFKHALFTTNGDGRPMCRAKYFWNFKALILNLFAELQIKPPNDLELFKSKLAQMVFSDQIIQSRTRNCELMLTTLGQKTLSGLEKYKAECAERAKKLGITKEELEQILA